MDDLSRQDATDDDKHTLTIEQVAELYHAAGHDRTVRSLQRYCKSGSLNSFKVQTALGDMYLITRSSVARHLAQLDEIKATTDLATSRDEPRPVATSDAEQKKEISKEPSRPTINDTSRPVATENLESRYVARLEGENEFLRGQVVVKDTQIAALNERVRETNLLTQGLQRLLAPLLRSPKNEQGRGDHDESAGLM